MKDDGCRSNHGDEYVYIYYIRIQVIPCLWYSSSFYFEGLRHVGLNLKSLKVDSETFDELSA